MSLLLKTDRLKVKIAEPGLKPNTTIRFDRAGFVEQVILDDKHHFMSREPHNLAHPCSGGAGLCSEFRFPEAAEEAHVGEKFIKPGIGILSKEEEKFFFYLPCETEPFEIEISKTPNGYLFETLPAECNGFALHHRKSVEAVDNRIIMNMKVTNTGSRTVRFAEYCHNFVTLDGMPIGPDYQIAAPVADQTGKGLKMGTALQGNQSGFGFSAYSNEASLVDVMSDEIDRTQPFAWTLSNRKTTAAISEKVSFEPVKFTVWAIDHVISPQVHGEFTLLPGETAEWTRTWTFDC